MVDYNGSLQFKLQGESITVHSGIRLWFGDRMEIVIVAPKKSKFIGGKLVAYKLDRMI